MNIDKLKQFLKEHLKYPDAVKVGNEISAANNSYCIEKRGAEWVVYFSERGYISRLTVFSSEEEACDYLLQNLKSEPYLLK